VVATENGEEKTRKVRGRGRNGKKSTKKLFIYCAFIMQLAINNYTKFSVHF